MNSLKNRTMKEERRASRDGPEVTTSIQVVDGEANPSIDERITQLDASLERRFPKKPKD
jgi:hypothetical protein